MLNKIDDQYCLLCSCESPCNIVAECSDFKVVKCLKCELIYQILSSFNPEQIYNNIYRNSPASVKSPPNLNNVAKDIQKYHKTPGSILDIGCGFGIYVKYYSDSGWDATGIDIFKGAVNYARSKGLNCHIATVEEYLTDKKFDVILMNHVLEHFKNPLLILNKIKDWLNNDGFIYIRVPNINSKAIRFIKANLIGHLKPFEHLYYFSPKTMESLLKKAGLKASLHLGSGLFISDIINYWIRSKITTKSSWINVNYKTSPSRKKTYLFFRDFYEKAVSALGYLNIEPKDRESEIVAIATKE